MDTKELEYIIAIAETGNLLAAADRLFITQSALSQHLAMLKKRGLPPLFTLNKRKMVLTDAGKIYLSGARTILRIENIAREKMNTIDSSRKLTFNFSVAGYLQAAVYLHILPPLRRRFAGVEFNILSHDITNIRSALENNQVDMAFIPDIYQQKDFFTYLPAARDELVLVSLPEHSPWALPMALPKKGTYLREICGRIFSQIHKIPEIYAETDDITTILTLVQQGECSCLMPKSMISAKGLHTESLPEPYFYNISCIYKKTAANPISDAIVSALIQYFQKTL